MLALQPPDPRDEQIKLLTDQLRAEKAMTAIANARLDDVENKRHQLHRYIQQLEEQGSRLAHNVQTVHGALEESVKRNSVLKQLVKDLEDRLRAMYEEQDRGIT